MKYRLLLPLQFLFFTALAQRPSGIPQDTKPADLSNPRDWLAYIVVPLILFVLYYLINRSRNNKS